MPLTDTAIRNAKPGNVVRKLSDGFGLQLHVQTNGSKLWRLAYRFGGKQKKLSIGPYPAIGLADARKKRDEAKALLASGIDPGQQKRADRLAKANGQENTFAVVAAELLAKKKREGKASNTIGKREWLYSLAGDAFSKRPIGEISAQEVLAVLQGVENKGLLETARRMRSSIGEVFRFAVMTGRATHDPTFALRGALAKPQVKHRAAILDAVQFGGLLRAIDGFKGQPTTVAALKLMAHVFFRPGELRQALWKDIDLEKGIWVIPAHIAKMRRPHKAPLSRQAIAILKDLHVFTGSGELVFPGIISVKKPISENTINLALRRMGYGPDEMVSHGFRATASTLLNQSGKWNPDAIEAALGHQDASAVRRAYARGEFWDERAQMAAWWSDHLDALKSGGAVIDLDAARQNL